MLSERALRSDGLVLVPTQYLAIYDNILLSLLASYSVLTNCRQAETFYVEQLVTPSAKLSFVVLFRLQNCPSVALGLLNFCLFMLIPSPEPRSRSI